jgi:hypothetical protein
MSTELIAHNADLRRLRDEGYDIAVVAGHLLMKDVPYVNAAREVKRGTLLSTLNMAGDKTVAPDTHVVFFAGEHPCDVNGAELSALKHGSGAQMMAGIGVQHSFSNKPPNGYPDYYAKMTRYAQIIADQAAALDETATPQTFPVVITTEEESVFKYCDTASSRAGIADVSAKLELGRIAIIGLGGTGSYIFDLVSKTPVHEIHLYDGDAFLNHNTFRCPGAASIADLESKPSKVAYLSGKYSEMRRGIIPHAEYVTTDNVEQLRGMDFVFVCIDRNAPKKVIADALIAYDIPFIDVGMGVRLQDGTLGGQVRTTTVTSNALNHMEARISFIDVNEDAAYDQNIQIADLNALNAALAVIKWKKLFGFYLDQDREHQSVYVIGGNTVINDEKLCD